MYNFTICYFCAFINWHAWWGEVLKANERTTFVGGAEEGGGVVGDSSPPKQPAAWGEGSISVKFFSIWFYSSYNICLIIFFLILGGTLRGIRKGGLTHKIIPLRPSSQPRVFDSNTKVPIWEIYFIPKKHTKWE